MALTLLSRLAAWISDLRLAIVLLLLIAIASGVGTAIPQREAEELYHRLYDGQPWLGLLNGQQVLALQLDHVYSSSWFLALLAWLALALLLCSWRRQWPALQAALRWIDYRSPRQLSKLSVAETLVGGDASRQLEALETLLRQRGWQLRRHPDRLAARRGVVGRVGPLLVHAGLVLLMLGAAWGALGGQRLEQFLAPGRSLELIDSRGHSQLIVALDAFSIQRDPAGRAEQFTSQLRLLEATSPTATPPKTNHSTGEPSGERGGVDQPLAANIADEGDVNKNTVDERSTTEGDTKANTAAARSKTTGARTAGSKTTESSATTNSAAEVDITEINAAESNTPENNFIGRNAAENATTNASSTAAETDAGSGAPDETLLKSTAISVNHPLRFRGITLYQADWSLAALTVQLGRSPLLQLPLERFPQLGDQVWGLVLPTRPDGSEPVLLAVSSEQGPVEVFGPNGQSLGQLGVGGPALEIGGLPIRVVSVLPASGILLKRDPGVPLVYAGFAVALLGGGLSLVATRQLWAIAEGSGADAPSHDAIHQAPLSPSGSHQDGSHQEVWGQENRAPAQSGPSRLHVAGLCNRNLTAFAAELPELLAELPLSRGDGCRG